MNWTKIIEKLIFNCKVGCIAFLSMCVWGYSQTDTLFWFAGPDISNGNSGNPNTDRPIYLRLSSYATPSNVVISQPANPGFVPINVAMPANSTSSINLTTWINIIENFPANTVFNRGLKITSTAPITAYYEVRSNNLVNPGIYNLKGQNGLGISFFIPTQTSFNNSSGYPDTPENSFEIVATQNATSVTITPSVAVVGHPAGVPYNIVLNVGQTYSCHAVGLTAADHLAGTRVVSNHPIAITIKDDLVRPNALPCADQMGDQIVPISKLGTDYICVKGLLNYAPDIPNIDYAYILATQNGTTVSVNGVYLATLNAGQTIVQNIASPSIYIQSSAPVYVLQVSGNGCEFGQSLIPPINNCSGNVTVSFTRSTNQSFYLLLLTEAGNESAFTVSSGAVVNPALFAAVPGTAGAWVSTVQTYTIGQIPVGTQINVSNSSGRFHMAFINGNSSLSGTMYGYFSDFIGITSTKDSSTLCLGDTIQLNPTTGADAFLWNDSSVAQNLTIAAPGIYYVDRIEGFCNARDSFIVSLSLPPSLDLGNDTAICQNQNILFSGQTAADFLWNTGDTTQSIMVDTSGIYVLQVLSNDGCSNIDTVQLTLYPLPNLDLGNDTTICSDSLLNLSIAGFSNYLWSNGDTTSTTVLIGPGTYSLVVSDFNQCVASDSIQIIWNNIPQFLQEDTSVCSAINLTIGSLYSYESYSWNTGDTTSSILASSSGLYLLEVVDQFGCTGIDSINVLWYPSPVLDLGNDITKCPNTQLLLNTGNYSNYMWSTGSDSSSTMAANVGIYYLNVTDSNGCNASDTIAIFDYAINYPLLPNDTSICNFDSISIATIGTYVDYLWNNGSSNPMITVTQSGLYYVNIVDSNNCQSSDSINVIAPPPLNLNLGNDTILCLASPFVLNAGPGYDSYLWNDASSGQTFNVVQSGQYFVSISENGCFDSDTINITYSAPPISILTDSINCISDSVLLDPGSNALTYLWNNGSTNQTIWASTDGIYSVVLFSNNCSITDSIYVNLYSGNEAVFPHDTTLCEGEQIVLAVPNGFDNYLWNNGTNGVSINVNSSGIYWVSISSCNGIWVDSVSVEFKPSIQTVYIPNVFTPNGDGLNDKFVLSGYNDIPSIFELLIYDRWGVLMFATNDFLAGWDGTFNGKLVPEGVYYFIVNMESSCGEKLVNNNFVTLFK